jgi:colanic acid biosynthesis glycosyl transferase WcaI
LSSVCFINRCYWPDSEATGQLLTELCEFLAPRWDVSALAGQPNWETENESFVRSGVQTRNGVAIHRLLHSRLPKSQRFARVRNLVSFTLAVRRWGKTAGKDFVAPIDESSSAERNGKTNGKSEIIVCETDPFLLPLVVGPMARQRKARLIYYLQDIYPDVAVAIGVAKNSVPIRFLRSRLKAEYLRAECIVVLDEDMRCRLVDWGIPKEKLRIVANWMDCSTVTPIKSNNPFRVEQRLDDHFVVMHSGNMGLTQRLDVLVDAMRLVSNQVAERPVTLALVGNGAKRKELEVQSAGNDQVRFFDYQPRDTLGASLSAADLHVVSMDAAITGCLAPSKLYGILASGTPLLAIVPKGNAVWRLVENERIGWNVEPGDRNGIAEAIRNALKMERHELKAMGERGRALAERLYDKQICCESFEAVLNSIG